MNYWSEPADYLTPYLNSMAEEDSLVLLAGMHWKMDLPYKAADRFVLRKDIRTIPWNSIP